MVDKIFEFLDSYAEKLIWVAIIAASLWILIFRVAISPNRVEYDRKRFGAGSIDGYIVKQSEELKVKLETEPERARVYDPCVSDIVSLFDTPIKAKGVLWATVRDEKKRLRPPEIYTLPEIGSVENVKVNHIRAAAYFPSEEVTDRMPYSATPPEVNDLDLVTVEAKYDVAALADRLYECFAGMDIDPEWRDPCLAKPVFEAVCLERQEQLVDGSWSEWAIVPRTRIDHRKKMFEVKETIEELGEGGSDVHLLLLDSMQVQMDLLQPGAYQIASAEDNWYPPSLYPEFRKQQDERDNQERKKAREARQKERNDRNKNSSGNRRVIARGRGGLSRSRNPRLQGRGGSTGLPGGQGRRSQEEDIYGIQGRKSKTEVDIEAKYDELLLTESTNFAKMKEPMVFWAFDDTVETGKKYRYRIRLGVLNKVSGTNQLKKPYMSKKDSVILWSDYSESTEVVSIPKRLYIFPTEAQTSPKSVKVQVSKYVRGYWYSKKFTVMPGEAIGKEVEYEPETEEGKTTTAGGVAPKTIDYSTGSILVDVLAVSDWVSPIDNKLEPRLYNDMLYTYDGVEMKHHPVQSLNWARDISLEYSQINMLEKRAKKPFQSWQAGQRGTTRTRMGRPGGSDQYDFGEEGWGEENIWGDE
jgi:hypothetical protein